MNSHITNMIRNLKLVRLIIAEENWDWCSVCRVLEQDTTSLMFVLQQIFVALDRLIHTSTTFSLITIKLKNKYMTVDFLNKYTEKRMNTEKSVIVHIRFIH